MATGIVTTSKNPAGLISRSIIGLKSVRRWIIRYLLSVFLRPVVRDEIAKYARTFMGEAGRLTRGIKGEAIESRETFLILARYIKKEKLSRAEKRLFKKQVVDMLKGAGVVLPVMLIPLPFVGTLLLIIMDHLLLSMNIRILPSSFYPDKKEGLLTSEGIEKDLEQTVTQPPDPAT
jgi:hypothetical protein